MQSWNAHAIICEETCGQIQSEWWNRSDAFCQMKKLDGRAAFAMYVKFCIYVLVILIGKKVDKINSVALDWRPLHKNMRIIMKIVACSSYCCGNFTFSVVLFICNNIDFLASIQS